MSLPDNRYLSDEYISDNPSWDAEDSPWKAEAIASFMAGLEIPTGIMCEVGCGAGGVLAGLRKHYPDSLLSGFDIAPTAASFWPEHAAKNINFTVGNVLY